MGTTAFITAADLLLTMTTALRQDQTTQSAGYRDRDVAVKALSITIPQSLLVRARTR